MAEITSLVNTLLIEILFQKHKKLLTMLAFRFVILATLKGAKPGADQHSRPVRRAIASATARYKSTTIFTSSAEDSNKVVAAAGAFSPESSLPFRDTCLLNSPDLSLSKCCIVKKVYRLKERKFQRQSTRPKGHSSSVVHARLMGHFVALHPYQPTLLYYGA
ncbi:hypothetical protein ARMGADRAFT_1022351 [Armillaria gallica]|uniref:Uncharacterized protein n=1 Tax=Armillaria gallica TaxID=47427 RepID=A0A2H3EKG1_ARMGA|nr:hypothetical protein ARMGADRAFT_1022351 [Armillaria gallica]